MILNMMFSSLKLKFRQGSLPQGANYKYYSFFSTLSTKRVNRFFQLTTRDSPDPLFFYLYALDFILLALDTNIAILVHLGNSLFFRH